MRAPGWAADRAPLLASVALLLVAAAVLFAVRPRASGEGFRALRALLADLGPGVEDGPAPTSGSTFFLPADLRGERDARDLLDWVRRGGRLVVADPASRTVELGGLIAGPPVGGLTPLVEFLPDCLSPHVEGVTGIVVAPDDHTWSSLEPRALSCFGSEGGAYVVQTPIGRGSLVAVGGTIALEDRGIGEADNAVLAWNLLAAPGQPVRIGPALPPGSEREAMGIWGLLPPGARGVLLQLGLAALILLLALGRRLGRPLEEILPAPIPGAALVGATAELYRRASARDHAAARLRGHVRSVIRDRLSLGPDAGDGAIASAMEDAGIASRVEVERLLSERVTGSDAVLTSDARDLADLEHAIAWREEG